MPDLDRYPVLITTTSTHLVMVAGTSQADAVAQIEDSGGADLDQFLDPDTLVEGDFTVRAVATEWDRRLVADHQHRTQRQCGPAVAA